jgi:hypothetical protein
LRHCDLSLGGQEPVRLANLDARRFKMAFYLRAMLPFRYWAGFEANKLDLSQLWRQQLHQRRWLGK